MAMLSANRRSPSLSPTSTRSLGEVTRSESLDSSECPDSLEHLDASSREESPLQPKDVSTTTGRTTVVPEEKEEEEDSQAISTKEKSANGLLEKDVCELSRENSAEDDLEDATPKTETVYNAEKNDEKEEKDEVKTAIDDCEVTVTSELVDAGDSGIHAVIGVIHEEEEPREAEEEEAKSEERTEIEEIEEDPGISEVDDEIGEHVEVVKTNDPVQSEQYDVEPEKSTETSGGFSSEFAKVCKVNEDDFETIVKDNSAIDNKKEEPANNGKLGFQGLYDKESNKPTSFKASTNLAFDRDLPRRSFHKFNSSFEANSDESPRLEGSSPIRGRFMPTGNVSRTAKLFEKLETENAHGNGHHHHLHHHHHQHHQGVATSAARDAPSSSSTSSSTSSSSTASPSGSTVTPSGKARSERIQRAFAFWNK